MQKSAGVIMLLIIVMHGIAQAIPIAEDSFDYPGGDLGGNGTPADSGWLNSWESTTWDVTVQGSGSLWYTDLSGNPLLTAGNSVITPASAQLGAWNKSYRTLQAPLTQSTYPEVWISFLIGDYNVGTAWAGVSLYESGSEKLFIGKTGNNVSLGVQEWNPGSSPFTASGSFTDPVLFVTRLVFESSSSVTWTSWLNPELDAAPADTDAFASSAHVISSIDQVRIAGQSGVVFDELRIGTTYDDVSPIPEPASAGLLALFAAGIYFLQRLFAA